MAPGLPPGDATRVAPTTGLPPAAAVADATAPGAGAVAWAGTPPGVPSAPPPGPPGTVGELGRPGAVPGVGVGFPQAATSIESRSSRPPASAPRPYKR